MFITKLIVNDVIIWGPCVFLSFCFLCRVLSGLEMEEKSSYFACPRIVPLAAPKCLSASLLLCPLSNTVSLPVGHLRASWSKVMQVPPAFKIFLLASSENERAQTVIFGNSKSLSSSRTFATTTAMLSGCFFIFFAMFDSDIGYLLTLLWFNLLKIVLLKWLSVLLARKV